jgi:hypothetical protein
MLLGQVVKDNVVRVTDLHSPGSASPRLPSPAVTAATASNPISTQSQYNKKDCTFSAAWHSATAGCHILSTSKPI